MHGELLLDTAAACSSVAARRALRRAAGQPRGRANSSRPRLSTAAVSTTLPLTLLYGHADRCAARSRRRHRRLRDGDARGGARRAARTSSSIGCIRSALDRPPQAAAALRRPAEHSRRAGSSCRSSCRSRRPRESRTGGAQSLRRHRDAPRAGGAVRRHSRDAGRRYRRHWLRTPWQRNCARRGSRADRRRRRGRTRATGRTGGRRGGDPRSGAADPGTARFEAALGAGGASDWPSRSASARWPGRSRKADVAEIDAINILQATLLAMRRAVERACAAPDEALDRRQSLPAARLSGARDRQGRPRHVGDLGCIDSRQDRPRRDAGRTRSPVSRLRIRAAQGLRHAAASRGARRSSDRVPAHRRSFAPVAQLRLDALSLRRGASLSCARGR